MMTIYPVVIAPLFNTFTPMEDGPLRQGIEALAGRLEFPLTKLFVVDGSTRSAHSNAYFYGIGKNKRIVLYDTLLTQVETEECVAILGHELGHWKMWHTIQGFVVSQLYMFTMFVVFSQCMNNDVLYSSFGFSPVHKTFIIGFSLFQNTLWSPIGKAIGFLMNINSRRNEFQVFVGGGGVVGAGGGQYSLFENL
jgi:STE24 endopeptidase